MSSAAIALMVISLVVLWGGLAASIVVIVRRPDRTDWPDGWEQHEDGAGDRPDEPVEHDT
ncbi:putative methionine/alanine importer small subunit [Promicromonospora sp. AC04]|uniref:methionine/alanine import family NSS transporter small subunit n=1 Tax=Promicromonospora sp. AC04 TaxID=2135723 RepID=UPI000D36EDC6|nr:methionine/alanine import family NSS transporter small subunit [Promicromonospora sp. AC04]PUB28723.1 putative methionine/alanine importer small subunit [Promicromonospora sp. AC04]